MEVFKEQLGERLITHIESCEEVDKFDPPYDFVFLDHDLGGRQLVEHEDSGYEFARLIKNRINQDAFVVIHSFNPDGARNIEQELRSVGLEDVFLTPFASKRFTKVMSWIMNNTTVPEGPI